MSPIRPENRALYPPNWRVISKWVRVQRAGNRCECTGECGYDHYGRCPAVNRDPHPVTGSKVVLTTAHLDHDPQHSDPANLRAMCQRCHNAYDAPHRAQTRQRTRAEAEQASP